MNAIDGTGRRACFLDRDGVIVEDVHHLCAPEQLVLIPGAPEAIAQLNRLGVPVVVVTNQSAVARGLVTEQGLAEIHTELDRTLRAFNARIDRYYYCPHHPTEGRGEYRTGCDCRKPAPGLLLRAADEMGLDLGRSILIGDKLGDIEAGHRAGCCTILVRTGYGAGYTPERLDAAAHPPHRIARDLPTAVRAWIEETTDGAVDDPPRPGG